MMSYLLGPWKYGKAKEAAESAKAGLTLLQCPVQLSPVKTGGCIPLTAGYIPWTTGIKLDLCICTIPTVGFYRKHGEVTATHHIRTSRMNCRRCATAAALHCLYCCQSLLLLPMDPTAAGKCCRLVFILAGAVCVVWVFFMYQA
jgi:hypothetical protein